MRLYLAFAITLASFATSAHAYVDPGAGMLAVQGLVALLIGAVAFIKHPVRTLRRWFLRRKDDPERDA
jgi:hypothetical protein